MLCVVMLSVIMLSVVAPKNLLGSKGLLWINTLAYFAHSEIAKKFYEQVTRLGEISPFWLLYTWAFFIFSDTYAVSKQNAALF